MFCACSFHGNSMNNLLSFCELVDARISASEKNLTLFCVPENMGLKYIYDLQEVIKFSVPK